MKLSTCGQMETLDARAAAEYGYPPAILMENAGRSAADFILRDLWKDSLDSGSLVVVAGKGNNGGDALVVARHLRTAGKRDISVVLLQDSLGELPSLHRALLSGLGVPVHIHSSGPGRTRRLLSRAAWIVDGLFGVGIKGPVREPAAGLIALINSSDARVVSLDLPSGLGDNYRRDHPAVRADHTLTFELPKLCLYLPAGRLLAGRVAVMSVGFPPDLVRDLPAEAELTGPEILGRLLRPPAPEAYKNTRGHLAVFAGAPGTTGAAALSSEAALRTGAGLVSLFADEDIYPVLAAGKSSVMVKPWNSSASPKEWDPSPYGAVLAGPGWGRSASRAAWLERILARRGRGVVDADGLHVLRDILRNSGRKPDLAGWVLTPHPGELSVLTDSGKEDIAADPLPVMDEFCRRHGCVLVLKSHVTYIREPSGSTWIHDGMNPALGTAGSGDVLSGIVAGLLCRGLPALDAARAGVELHGLVGAHTLREKGFFTAEDLLPGISREAWRNAEIG